MRTCGFSLYLLALILSLLCTPSQAQTPRIQGQGTAASGMGNAFAAQADDASAIHYNPAGMAQLSGVHTMVGTLFVGGTTKFTSPTGVHVTGDRGGSMAWPPPSHLYVTANLKTLGVTTLRNLTLGLGVNSPFGALTRYPTDAPFRHAVTYNMLPLLDIKPTVAYRLNNQLSFGLGADIYTFSGWFGEGHLEQQSIWPGGLGIPAGSPVELNGRDTAVGFNVSLLYIPLRNAEGKPIASIGLVYRSQATLHLEGGFRANGRLMADAAATFVLPQVYTAGLAIWPVRDGDHEWKIELDVDYIGWQSVRNLDVHLSNGLTLPRPQTWRNAYTAMIGIEYKWLNVDWMPNWEIALRAGYMNQQTQMPDLTFNPGVPSAPSHIPSVGLGLFCRENGSFMGWLKCGDLGIGKLKPKSFAIDISYQAVLYEARTVMGNLNPTINGTYQTLGHSAGVSLRLNY